MKKYIYIIGIILIFIVNGYGSDLHLKDTWKYTIDYTQKTIQISGGKISNKSDYRSGTIKMAIFISDTLSTTGEGYFLSEYKFDPLDGGYCYTDIDKSLDFLLIPPDGSYHVKICILEYTENGYENRDFLNFKGYLSMNYNKNARNQQFFQQLYLQSLQFQEQIKNMNSPHKHLCTWCNGSGRCHLCNGTGIHRNYLGSNPCHSCSSTGICRCCNGSGYIIY